MVGAEGDLDALAPTAMATGVAIVEGAADVVAVTSSPRRCEELIVAVSQTQFRCCTSTYVHVLYLYVSCSSTLADLRR